MIGPRRAVVPNGRCPAHSAWRCCPACRCLACHRSDQVGGGRMLVGPTRRYRLAGVELPGDPMAGMPDDPIQCLHRALVEPPDVRICSADVQIRSLDAPIRWKADRTRPDRCHCSSPTRSERDWKNGHSMVRQICFSTGSGRIGRLPVLSRIAQSHRAAEPVGFATPTAGLAHSRLRGNHARPCRLGLLHRCFAGHRRAPTSLLRPAWAPVPDSGNRQCHAGAENQTVFEGSWEISVVNGPNRPAGCTAAEGPTSRGDSGAWRSR
jgi:hypothetical protein